MFIFSVSAARLLLVFAFIHLPCCWSAHKCLAPLARTLLGGLGQATLSFFAIATLLFVFFCVCPKFFDLAKQRRKIFGGVSEVGKDDFSALFFLAVRRFLGFCFFFCCDRATPSVVLSLLLVLAQVQPCANGAINYLRTCLHKA